jgi:hypothetical protein
MTDVGRLLVVLVVLVLVVFWIAVQVEKAIRK